MIAAILGQILELSEAENWEQTTGITVDETTAFWDEIYQQFSQGVFCMIGSIVAILNNTTPENMLLCDGSNFDRVDYPELYAVLPSALIVDPDTGKTPDLRETFVLASGVTIAEHSTGGSDEHTLATNEMPAHTHSYDKPVIAVDLEGAGVPDPTAIGSPFLPTQSGSTGGGAAHNNMPPYYSLKYTVIAK